MNAELSRAKSRTHQSPVRAAESRTAEPGMSGSELNQPTGSPNSQYSNDELGSILDARLRPAAANSNRTVATVRLRRDTLKTGEFSRAGRAGQPDNEA